MTTYCRTCKFWFSVGADELGECHAHPPAFVDDGCDYPSVAEGDWCGEHKERKEWDE